MNNKDNSQEKPSDALFQAILEKARHPKTKRAAENIRNACNYLQEHNIEISISQVADFCKDTGPRAQSIHNKKEFGAYIKARWGEQELPVKPSSEALKFETKDPQANAVIYALQSEVKRVRQQLQNFKRALSDAGDYDLDATVQTGRLVRLVDLTPSVPLEVVDVLRRLLDAAHLRKFGLNYLKDRIIAVDRNDRVFVEKADLQRLAAITAPKDSPKELPLRDAPKQLPQSKTP
jgi:hypothetical protein